MSKGTYDYFETQGRRDMREAIILILFWYDQYMASKGTIMESNVISNVISLL